MNLSFTRGDEESCVRENFRRMGKAIGFATEDLVFTHQTHTACVRVVGERERGCGFTRPLPYQDVDGLVTNVPGLVLTAFFADCVPLFFADPRKESHRPESFWLAGNRGEDRPGDGPAYGGGVWM